MNETFFLLVLLFYADVRHRYNNNSPFFLSFSFLFSCSVHIVDTPTMPSLLTLVNCSLSLSLQMGISKERAIAVINIIMSALLVCTVAVALFDLLYGIFFSSLSLNRRKRTKFDCIESLFFSLTMTVVYRHVSPTSLIMTKYES